MTIEEVKVVGTRASREVEDKRGWLCADWMVHTYLPLWLRTAGMEVQAKQVEALPAITNYNEWEASRPTVKAVRELIWKKRQEVWEPFKAKLVAEIRERVPVADAVADADAAYGTKRYWAIRDAVYFAVRGQVREAIDAKFPEVRQSAHQSAFTLLDQMIALGATA